jgi:hypothetical protein
MDNNLILEYKKKDKYKKSEYINIIDVEFKYINYYNLILFKSEIRKTLYKLLFEDYYLKYIKLNEKSKKNIDINEYINKYFNNINLFLFIEKYTNINLIIYLDKLTQTYFYIICHINNNVFINNNQITEKSENVIKSEFINYFKNNKKILKSINYSRYNIFYYKVNNDGISFNKITKNRILHINSFICVKKFLDTEYSKIKEFIINTDIED